MRYYYVLLFFSTLLFSNAPVPVPHVDIKSSVVCGMKLLEPTMIMKKIVWLLQ